MEECDKSTKYKLSWSRPEDTINFKGYRIYLDTTPPNTPARNTKEWEFVRSRPELASIIVETKTPTDSIIFVFGNSGFKQDSLNKDTKKIFVIDTTGRPELETGRLVFALVPVYGGDVTPGQPLLSWFIINDKTPPDFFSPVIKPMAKDVVIWWARPTDPTSFFDPTLDTGLILNYTLKVTLGGRNSDQRDSNFSPSLLFYRGGLDVSKSVLRTPKFKEKSDKFPFGYSYYLPDSTRGNKRTPTLQDSLKVVLSNLSPTDTLSIILSATDSSLNDNENLMQPVIIHLTDTTQPSKPRLSEKSPRTDSNSVVIAWTASRDSLVDGGQRLEGRSPNFLIQEYHLVRTMIRDSTEKKSILDRMDTVIRVVTSNRDSAIFLDTMRYLPPGRSFFLTLYATDKSGFESSVDTLTIKTPSIQFSGNDSDLICPKGFLPIPRARFTLGSTGIGSQSDESPSKNINLAAYCIEPYEHRSAEGNFVSNVSWSQADSICRGINTAYNTQLCSEVEWERTCKGPGPGDFALAHGIQSEQKNASILQSTCNQGTNDSVMARSFDLRSGTCLTNEGVYDMAGNYSEWIRDPYSEGAYGQLKSEDSLTHGFSFSDSLKRHGFRGGNYLKPQNLATSSIQNLARCSNRDFAQQVRPVFKKECIDSSGPQIAIIYGPGLSGHFCIPLDSKFSSDQITDLSPAARDTTGKTILVFLKGKAKPDTIKFSVTDTNFRGKKPQMIRLTTRSLALVSFVKGASTLEDFLDATEMRDTSRTNLEKIFARESGQSGWRVKEEGGKYIIKYFYAYTIIGTKPAQEFYSSRAISFRCCSLAIKKPL